MSDILYRKILEKLAILEQDNKVQAARLDDIQKQLRRLEGK